jgi:TPR repeat protein
VLLGLAQETRGLLDAARHAYRRAAADGDGRAAHKLGMLSDAAGDEEDARQWFLEGARAGEASSMFNLAGMQATPERGARWMVLAAAHQHPAAALHVGYQEVELGRPAEAVRWLRHADELGEPRAAQVLAALLAQAPSLRGVGRSGPGGR